MHAPQLRLQRDAHRAIMPRQERDEIAVMRAQEKAALETREGAPWQLLPEGRWPQ